MGISKYKQIITTEQNIIKYKETYPHLCHVKTGEGYQGILLLDRNKFVAVLQCNVLAGYIVALEVSAEYRRQGIATGLLRMTNNVFNCHKLTVNENNAEAIALYKKFGYKQFDHIGKMIYMEK